MKKYKTSCKTAEGGKTYGVDSSGRLDTRFYSWGMKINFMMIVWEEKIDFFPF